ncbi:MAG: NHL repeat-containing protein [Candidatus Kariarchaeaceae archaeon]|jgi:DNA-binding beta-propeller fold protein YncE
MKPKNLQPMFELLILTTGVIFWSGTYLLNVSSVDSFFGYRAQAHHDDLTYLGKLDAEFSEPWDVVVINDYIYVTDPHNERVAKFNLQGEYVREFGTPLPGNRTDQQPQWHSQGIAANETHILVTESDGRIQIFDIEGSYISHFGSLNDGSGDGEFHWPRGIAVDGTHIYVVDHGNSRVQIFDLSGQYQYL